MEDFVVEEELSGDERCAGVNLAAEIGEVSIERRCLRMLFGIAGDAEADIGMQAFQQRDDITAVAKGVLEGGGGRRVLWHVAAEGHDVANAARVVGFSDGS